MGRTTDPAESSKKLLSDVELTVSDYLVPSNRGYYDYQDSSKSSVHVGGGYDPERTESFDTERTESDSLFGEITRDGYGDMEVDSHGKNKNASHGQGPYMEADSRHQSVRSHVEGDNLNIPPWRSVEQRRNFLPLPSWFKDLVKKSNVAADMDGWEHYEIIRNDYSAADKYFTHKHYRHTFRSEPEVARFLATGKVKKNKIWQKISADRSGQDAGASRPTKRKAVPHTPSNNPQGSGWPRGGNSLTFISRELREHGWL